MVLYNDTLYNEKKADENSFVVSAGQCYQLNNVNKPINKMTIHVKGSGLQSLYPGAIVYADKHLSEGNPIPLANIARKPTQIYGTFLSGQSTLKTVDASTAGNVHAKIGEMLRELFGSGKYQPAGKINYSSSIYSSKTDMMYSMGVDATFGGNNLKVNAAVTNNESTFIQDTSLDQDFYTVRLNDNYRDDVSKLFGDNVTWNEIQKESYFNGKQQPLAIITSVTYGRSVHFLKEFSTKSFTFKGDQSYKGFGAHATLKEDIAKSSECTNVQLISIGDAGAGSKIISGKMSDEEIRTALGETSTFGVCNQGVPVSYTVELISGVTPGVSIQPVFDGNVVESEYQRCPSSVQLWVKMGTWTVASEKNVKVKFTFNTFRLGKRADGSYYKIPGRTNVEDEKRYDDSSKYDIRALPLQPGEYLDGYVKLQVRCKASSVSSWHNDIADAPLDASSGKIDLILAGTTRAGSGSKAYIDSSSPTQIVGS
jgi:thiol-activated cytolysin